MALIFLHGRGLTRQVLDSVYEESNYFTTSDPSTLRNRQVIFGIELLNLKDTVVDVPLQLCKILEGRSTTSGLIIQPDVSVESPSGKVVWHEGNL